MPCIQRPLELRAQLRHKVATRHGEQCVQLITTFDGSGLTSRQDVCISSTSISSTCHGKSSKAGEGEKHVRFLPLIVRSGAHLPY
jgi:hypothetical protein